MDALHTRSPASQPLSIQAPGSVVMARPRQFSPNPETAADNGFQTAPDRPANVVAQRAHDKVTLAAETLRTAGV